MKPYTVALLRPRRFITYEVGGYERQGDLGYLAEVKASSVKQAIYYARQEVCAVDRTECGKDILDRCLAPIVPEEYTLLWVFSGHPEVAAFGFEE